MSFYLLALICEEVFKKMWAPAVSCKRPVAPVVRAKMGHKADGQDMRKKKDQRPEAKEKAKESGQSNN